MKIQFVWDEPSPHSAIDIAGKISEGAKTGLLPGYYRYGDDSLKQCLSFEAPGLAQKAPTSHNFYVTIVERIRSLLLSCGITAKIIIDDIDILHYAAQQEAKVTCLKICAQETVHQLKKMRSWFKDSRVADIRRNLEQSIKDVPSGKF